MGTHSQVFDARTPDGVVQAAVKVRPGIMDTFQTVISEQGARGLFKVRHHSIYVSFCSMYVTASVFILKYSALKEILN